MSLVVLGMLATTTEITMAIIMAIAVMAAMAGAAPQEMVVMEGMEEIAGEVITSKSKNTDLCCMAFHLPCNSKLEKIMRVLNDFKKVQTDAGDGNSCNGDQSGGSSAENNFSEGNGPW